VLAYAEIPYDIVYDEEIIQGKLPLYDWLHLHHEDFTGQYGKFYAQYHNAPWYQEQVRTDENMAHKLGFNKVSELKLGVAQKIRDFTAGGGFLFTMCSGTDSYDIALAAAGLDICEKMYDGDGTTAFNKALIRPEVLVMGENKGAGEAKYIHGEFGKGTWTFYGGHDPEDYQHMVGDPPTDLSLHPNSPGYRLILNNILFPAAKKKKQKT
jgi:hypothetical protein